MSFQGFSRDGLALLTELPKRDKAWFAEARARYTRALAEPAKAFVAVLGAELRSMAPGLQFQARSGGSLSPIHNDRRFAKDKPAYKDHLLFRFWEGSKKEGATLFVRLSPEGIGFATGLSFSDPKHWRAFVAAEASGAPLARAIAALRSSQRGELAGPSLKRVPKPFQADHPRGELLRCGAMVQVRWQEPVPACVTSARFIAWCRRRLERCAAVHAALKAAASSS